MHGISIVGTARKRKDANDEAFGDDGSHTEFSAELPSSTKSSLIRADRRSASLSDQWFRQAAITGWLLITNALDLTPAEAVTHYKALADIKRGSRVLKSDIEIAPVHHRLPDRIRAHALICFLALALVLYRVMRVRLKAKGHAASPRTALDLLTRIQRHQAKVGERSVAGLSTTTPDQLELFETPDLPKPA